MSTCKFEGCGRDVKAKGLCEAHYNQTVRGKPLTPLAIRAVRPKICTFEGCGKPSYAKGLCQAHYDRQKVGLPTTITKVCAVIGCNELVTNHKAKLCRKHSDENAAYWRKKIDEDTIRQGTWYD